MVGCYLLLSAGIQLHVHYCCGQLSDVHFFDQTSCNHTDEDADHCCKKNSCCSYVHLDFNVDDSHEPTASMVYQTGIVETTPLVLSAHTPFAAHQSSFSFQEDSSPPIGRRYVLYHSLILYA